MRPARPSGRTVIGVRGSWSGHGEVRRCSTGDFTCTWRPGSASGRPGPGCTWSARSGGPPGLGRPAPPGARGGRPAVSVLSVAPRRVAASVRWLAGRRSALLAALPAAVGRPGWAVHDDVFRWSLAPAPLPDVGEWTTRPPPGCRPGCDLFDRPVLVVRDPTAATWPGSGSSGTTRTGTNWRSAPCRRPGAAAWPVGWSPRRRGGCSTRGGADLPARAGRTPPPPGSPRRPASRTGAGARTASIRADRPGWPSGGARTVDPGPDPRSATSPQVPGSGCSGTASGVPPRVDHATYRTGSGKV